jgi:lipid II:glycine glycyltransferase (peptidoglycan interpeptide bridge formation enzyme)
LIANGATKIEIRDSPAIVEPAKSALLANIFHRRGYIPTTPDLDYFLFIDEQPIWEKLKPSRRQRIHRCRREGITARTLEVPDFARAYEVILENRKSRGFPISMSFESLERMREVFPGRLLAFGAFKGEQMIASSICMEVNSSVFYVFYWGDLPGYEKFSPVTLLAEYIYDFAQERGFKLIDFGTATKDGDPIYGLINFKKEIGGFPSLKPGYQKLVHGSGKSVAVPDAQGPEALATRADVLK